MMALFGAHHLWHPNDSIGMRILGRQVRICCYPGRVYHNSQEFCNIFETVVGHFGKYGEDLDQLDVWLTGTAFNEQDNETCNQSNVRRISASQSEPRQS